MNYGIACNILIEEYSKSGSFARRKKDLKKKVRHLRVLRRLTLNVQNEDDFREFLFIISDAFLKSSVPVSYHLSHIIPIVLCGLSFLSILSPIYPSFTFFWFFFVFMAPWPAFLKRRMIFRPLSVLVYYDMKKFGRISDRTTHIIDSKIRKDLFLYFWTSEKEIVRFREIASLKPLRQAHPFPDLKGIYEAVDRIV
jgi:hypothetical protein